MKQIVTLTMNPAIDINSQIDNVMPEKKLRCSAPSFEPGGGGINVSRAIRKLGGDSTAMYPSGGRVGKMLTDLIDRERVKHHPFQIQNWTRQNFIVFEKSTTQQFRFGMPGPELKETEWKQCLGEIGNLNPPPDYIVASGSLPPGAPQDFYARMTQRSKDIGARVIVDTSQPALSYAVEAGVFLIKPNLRELQELAGKELPNEEEQEETARQIVKKGQSEIVVVSLGAAGVLAVWEDQCKRLRAPTVPIKSKVGAGDSTVAGIVLSLAQGRSILDSIMFGMAAGAAAVMTPGTELCRKEDTEKLYKQMQTKWNSL